MKIFGREPAVWLGLVAVAVQTGVAWGMDLTDDQQAGVNAVAALLLGLAVAVVSARDQIVPAAAGLLTAVLQLAVAFGWDLSPDKIATAGALLTALLAAWLRTQVTAPVDPTGARVPKQTVYSRRA